MSVPPAAPRRTPAARVLAALVFVHALVALVLVPGTADARVPAAAHGAPSARVPPARVATWAWPVPAPIRVLAPFRAPLDRYSEGHRGIDLAVAPGAVVMAAEAGVVRYAGWVGDRWLVAIDHGEGVVSSLEPVEPSVAKGDAVQRGDPIGHVSVGGHCAAGCAHFGVRVDDEYVSPLLFLGGVPRAVLLPLDG